jgi:OOP family OmpA-OmpF porin
MFESTPHRILIGIVTGTLLSAAVSSVLAEDTHRLIDSEGNPVLTTREGECVLTPVTPNTPPKPFEKCGDVIDVDSDKDGIMDSEDECPHNTAVEISKGVYKSGSKKGCPLDSDNDGVPDYLDDCPLNTPLEISKGVDEHGCPLDSDQDGVPDYRDKCPGTPLGVAVDNNGCGIIGGTKVVILSGDVNFAFDSDKLTPQARVTLDEIAGRVNVSLLDNIEIVGHTDSIGTDKYNQRLSDKRAASVAKYLVAKGIPFDKITHRGEGEKNPIAPNDTKLGRAQNRRVEIQIKELKAK